MYCLFGRGFESLQLHFTKQKTTDFQWFLFFLVEYYLFRLINNFKLIIKKCTPFTFIGFKITIIFKALLHITM